MKLYLALEKIFLFRLSGNDQLKQYIHKVSMMGKFDEPKKIAVFSLILERIAALEEELEILRDERNSKLPPNIVITSPVNTPVATKKPEPTKKK